MEPALLLDHRRMLELYANYAQLGPRIYGICSASWYYFDAPPSTSSVGAVAQIMLVMAWRVFAAQRPYEELGVEYFTRREDPRAHARRLAREIQKLGVEIILRPHAA